jgi:uncharacterized protein YndB with AHSA1/START domain
MTDHMHITREFDAPPEVVFAAWTDPDQVAEWWGPEHFHVPRESVSIDARPGGHFQYTMVQDGAEEGFPSRSEITEFVENRLIVMRNDAIPAAGIGETTMRAEFEDLEGRTRLTVTGGPYEGDMTRMAQAGMESQLDKLDSRFVTA